MRAAIRRAIRRSTRRPDLAAAPLAIPIAALVAVSLATGCAGEPPVLEVGRIGYSEIELQGLTSAQQELLVDLTAFGAATADRRLDEVARPFVSRDLRSLLLQRAALEIGAAAAGLDEEALREAYRSDPEYELRVRHLVVVSERWRPAGHRDSAEARADEAAARARAAEPFETLVEEYSDEPGAAMRGGLLEPGREGSWVSEFWSAASALAPGEVSGVVETEYGFHVIRLESRDTIPYEEVRDRVVEQSVSLAEAFAGSQRWLEERARSAEIDTAAIAAWQAGRDPDDPLVRWPGTRLPAYTSADLDDHALSLPPEQLEVLEQGDAAQAARLVEAAARNSVLLEHARSLGIEPSPPQRTAIEQQWATRLGEWATALGFMPGMADRTVKASALAAVTGERQEVLRARTEVVRLARVLRGLYPVSERSSVVVNRLTNG